MAVEQAETGIIVERPKDAAAVPARVENVRALLVAMVLAAAGVTAKKLFVDGLAIDPYYLLYFPCIALSTWYGGVWPGVLTTILCGVANATLFDDPVGASLQLAPEQLRLALFVIAGSITSALTGLLRTARSGAEATREELRETVRREEDARRAVEQVAVRLDVVRVVTGALTRAVTPRDVADAVLEAASRTLGMRAGAVALTSPETDALLTVSTLGYPPEVLESTRRLALDASLPISDAARSRQPLWFETEQQLRDAYPILSTFPDYEFDGSMAVLPLTAEDRLIGAMWLRFAEPRTFATDDQSFITALAQQCAQALERARLFEAERQSRTEAQAAEERLALLAEASAVLGSSPELEANLDRLARLVAGTTGDWVEIDLLDERDTLRVAALAHADAEREAKARAFRGSHPLDTGRASAVAHVLASGESLLVPDITAVSPEADLPAEIGELARDLGVRSLILAPLRSGGRSSGVIAMFAAAPERRYGEQDQSFLSDLARRVSSALETVRLYRQLDQFKGTVDASLDAVFMFDPETLHFAYVNRGAVAQLGYSRERLLEMRALDIEPNFDEDGYRDLIGSLTVGGQPSHTFTTVHRRADGREIPVEIFLQAVRLPGGDAVMVANARDISERIEAQARLYRLARAERSRAAELNAVLQAMGEAILVCDSDGKVLLANQSAERLFGTLPSDYAELGAKLVGTQGPLPPLGVEGGPLEMHLVGGADRWLELTSYPVVLESPGTQRRPGATTSVATIMVMRDVTEVREAQALREAFLGVLSHELRTPITTIYGTTKVLTRRSATLDPATRDELIADIGAEADRLYRIVEDLVVLSRAETGIELEGEPLLLRHLVPTVVASERQRWPSTDFDIQLPERLPTVNGDATYIEQVLRNLLGNAAKYSPPASTVTVVAEASDDEVLVRVLDRGIGIEPEEVGRLFDLFYRSPGTAAKARGAGIGLWVCRRLVEGMGGRIWARPRDGGGSEFGFSLRAFAETDVG